MPKLDRNIEVLARWGENTKYHMAKLFLSNQRLGTECIQITGEISARNVY